MSYIRKCDMCGQLEDNGNISTEYDDKGKDWGMFVYQGKDTDICHSCVKKIKKFISQNK